VCPAAVQSGSDTVPFSLASSIHLDSFASDPSRGSYVSFRRGHPFFVTFRLSTFYPHACRHPTSLFRSSRRAPCQRPATPLSSWAWLVLRPGTGSPMPACAILSSQIRTALLTLGRCPRGHLRYHGVLGNSVRHPHSLVFRLGEGLATTLHAPGDGPCLE
jgi:hypothetical protein